MARVRSKLKGRRNRHCSASCHRLPAYPSDRPRTPSPILRRAGAWFCLGSLVSFAPALGDTPRAITLPADQPLSNFVVTEWNLGDGLPMAAINDLIKPDGDLLWLATYSGLFRFDGRRFTAVDEALFPELRASGHLMLHQHQGELFIGTQADGLLKWSNGRFERYGAQLAQAHEITSMLVDSQGEVWVTATDSGAYRYVDGKPTPLEGPGLGQGSVYRVLQDRDGSFWFGTEGTGLVHLRDGIYTTYGTADGLPNNRVGSLYQGHDGSLWVGTLAGLAWVREDRVEPIPELAGFSIDQMLEDQDGNLWMASRQGLLRWSPTSRRLEQLSAHRGRPLRNLTGLISTEEGNLWFCTHSGGLFQVRESRFTNYDRDDGLATEIIGSVGELDPETRLVGTGSGVIHRIVGTEVSRFGIQTPIPDTQIRDIFRDREERLWISSDAGLLTITREGETLYSTRNGLPDDQVRLTRQDRRGELWVGTGGGAARLVGEGSFEALEGESELTSNLILSIADDPMGNLWIGTRGGLLRRSPDGTLKDYLAGRDLPGSLAFSSYSDDRGQTWVCTNRGLARLRGDTVDVWTSAAGLPAESIFDYVEDDRGFSWLSSSIGLIRLSKQQLVDFMDGKRERIEALVLDDRDGMVSPSCTGARKMLRADDGRLWVPTLAGVAVIDPGRLELNAFAPRILIHGLSIDGAAIDPDALSALSPGAKRFAFDFATLSFEIPSKVRTRYRLVGFDSDWVDAGMERSAIYTRLPHGDYTFQVIAANNDGLWNEEGASLEFRIDPFFHQTPLFYLLLVGSLALCGWALYTWRIRIFERAEQKLRESEKRLRLLFTKASDAILIISSGRVADCNARACEIFGYPHDELVGCSLDQLCPRAPRESSAREASLADAVALLEAAGTDTLDELATSEMDISGPSDLETRPSQFQQIRRDGSRFDSEVSLVALRSGGRLLVQAIVRDVSERVRLIEELGARSLELERFIYTVSHDLKSPLYTIHGFLGLLGRDLEEGRPRRASQDMERIRAAVTRMGRLLDELLELSRIGRLDNEPQEVALVELAHEAVALVEGRITDRDVSIEISPDLPRVFGDRPRLLAVLQNLLDNAAKFMDDKPRGRIEIGSRWDGYETVFFVRDNGVGFDPRYKEKVFGLFEQLNPGREGTGIGLAIVKRVIEVHGGRIWAESDGLGQGSTFCFTLAQDRVVARVVDTPNR